MAILGREALFCLPQCGRKIKSVEGDEVKEVGLGQIMKGL